MKGYFRLYCWLRHVFPDHEFTSKQFKAEFKTPQYTKVLHDLTRLGYIERNKRGEYRIKSPREIEDNVIKKDLESMHILEGVKDKKFAFSHSNAIRIWSNGKYHPGITRGLKPIHLKILNQDLGWWEHFLTEHGATHYIGGENKTLFGVTYILHPSDKLDSVKKHGMPVVSLHEALKTLDPAHPHTREIKQDLRGKD